MTVILIQEKKEEEIEFKMQIYNTIFSYFSFQSNQKFKILFNQPKESLLKVYKKKIESEIDFFFSCI